MTVVHCMKMTRQFGTRAISELFPSVRQELLQRVDKSGWHIDTPQSYCGRCGASVGLGAQTSSGCAYCIGKRTAWQKLVRLSAYQPPMDEWIRAMKFNGRWASANWLGRLLAQILDEPQQFDRTVVCSVPMHWLRRLQRGYNQADLLATSIARIRQWPVAPLLRRTRQTAPQTRVAPSQRKNNIRNAFQVCQVDLSGWDVILVDDVKTTGSTLTACTRLLRKRGARFITVAVAAVADAMGADFTIK